MYFFLLKDRRVTLLKVHFFAGSLKELKTWSAHHEYTNMYLADEYR